MKNILCTLSLFLITVGALIACWLVFAPASMDAKSIGLLLSLDAHLATPPYILTMAAGLLVVLWFGCSWMCSRFRRPHGKQARP